MTIPGEDMQLPESDLLQEIGKYLMLFQHEQKKRMVLVQAYNDLKGKYDALAPSQYGDVVLGNP